MCQFCLAGAPTCAGQHVGQRQNVLKPCVDGKTKSSKPTSRNFIEVSPSNNQASAPFQPVENSHQECSGNGKLKYDEDSEGKIISIH